MTKSSLVKNVPFKNIGPTIMSVLVVELKIEKAKNGKYYLPVGKYTVKLGS